MRVVAAVLAIACTGSFLVSAQQRPELAVVQAIKVEAFDRSQVMDHARELSDRFGGRLTGSAQFDAAAKWAVERLRRFGVSDARLEPWGKFGRSWSAQEYSVEQLAPYYASLIAVPLAWSAPTSGPVSGEPLLAPLGSDFFTDGPSKAAAALDVYRKQWSGKLRGQIVLISASPVLRPRDTPSFRRYTDAELAQLTQAPTPRKLTSTPIDELQWPSNPAELGEFFEGLPEAVHDQIYERYEAWVGQRAQFFAKEGVAALLVADSRARDTLVAAEHAGSFRAKDTPAPATFLVTAEHYSRLVRLAERKQSVRVRVNLKVQASVQDVDATNIVAELPGGAKNNELVMIGAHFDSWHAAGGATDNAAGSAVMMEVMRILKALDLKMDRTVRLALWSGEEQGLLGSKAYVKAHFGDPAAKQTTAEHATLSAYFNLDNGSGKIRGVYLQGNEAARPSFESWLAPFRDLGATTIAIRDTGGTDHLAFAAVGLPGFQFIQDPLDYGRITHHTTADTYDHIVATDMMQAAAVIASIVYHAANAPERMPRRDLPAALRRSGSLP